MKGYTVDCRYVYSVAMLMENMNLPAPRLKRPARKYLTDSDGTYLPIVTVEV